MKVIIENDTEEILKINVCATFNFLIKEGDDMWSYADDSMTFIMLIAQARYITPDKNLAHRFESEPIATASLNRAAYEQFSTKVGEWCKNNLDKFGDATRIPPKIRL